MWNAPIADIRKLTDSSGKYILEQAEKRLRHLLELSERTTNRAIAILSGLIPVNIYLITLIFNNYYSKTGSLSLPLITLCWISLAVIFVSIILSSYVAFPRDMHQVGSEPKNIFTDELMKSDFYVNELQCLTIIVGEIEDLQNRIDFMQEQNNKRVVLTKISFAIFGIYAVLCTFMLCCWVLSMGC